MAKGAAKTQPAKPAEIPAEILALTFEAAMAQLDEIVRKLESGRVGLEESIAVYAQGVHLKRHCEAKLRAAEERIEKIVIGADGNAAGSVPVQRD